MNKILNSYFFVIKKYSIFFIPIPFLLPLFTIIFNIETDHNEYLQIVFDNYQCNFQGSLCRNTPVLVNKFIVYITGSSSINLFLLLAQYVAYLLIFMIAVKLLSTAYKSIYLPELSLRYGIASIALLPSIFFIVLPAKEIFQLLSIIFLILTIEAIDKNNYARSFIFFSISIYIASSAHVIFYFIPILSIFLIFAFRLFSKLFSLYRYNRRTYMLFYFFICLGLLTLFLSTNSYVSEFIESVNILLNKEGIFSDASTNYPRISGNPLLTIIFGFVFFVFSPVPGFGGSLTSSSLYAFDTLLFITTFSFIAYTAKNISPESISEVRYKQFLISILVIITLTSLVWSIGTINWGTAVRHRSTLVFITSLIAFRIKMGNIQRGKNYLLS